MRNVPSDIAFTPAVKAIQERKGSRKSYARMERGDGWQTKVIPDLAEFIAELQSEAERLHSKLHHTREKSVQEQRGLVRDAISTRSSS